MRFFLTFSLFSLATQALHADDWPQFMGPDRNGVSAEKGLRFSWPKQGPPLLWEKRVGAGFAGPVVAGRRLILFHRLDNDEVVDCLDSETGKEQWSFKYPTTYRDDFGFDEGPRATPLIAGDRVFTLGAEGRLHCIDLASGQAIWQRSLSSDYASRKGYFGVGTSPLLAGANLLINIGGRDAGIIALNKDNAKEVWRATNHEASYSSPVIAEWGGARHAVFLTREGIVVVNPADGSVTYQKHFRARGSASVNAASPLAADGYLFFSASYGTGAILLRPADQGMDEIWKSDEVLSNHYTTSLAQDGYLYGFDGRQEEGARLRCVELKSGKVAWTVESFGCGSMILADGHLLVLHEKGELIVAAASPTGYQEESRAPLLTGPCRSGIALSNGRLVARDAHRLVCLNLKK
jgi:outer membrane protein assembly factor BamB